MRWLGGGGAGRAGVEGVMPSPVRVVMIAASDSSASSGSWVTTLQAAVRWFKSPQGDPSGVCTGHKNPQDSGSNLRTVVVRNSAKYAPLCIERK